MRPTNLVPLVLASVAAIALPGCTQSTETVPITEKRELAAPRPESAFAGDAHVRMGLAEGQGFVHPPMDGAGAPTPSVGGFDQASLAWKAPAGWTEGAARQMRVVTMTPADAPGAECYVTMLSGAAGGFEANVDRWRGQLKLAPLAPAEMAKLPVIQVLGRDARLVEIDGGAVGLLGVVCPLGGQTLFVKMTGPMESLRAERERFVEFCTSLSQK